MIEIIREAIEAVAAHEAAIQKIKEELSERLGMHVCGLSKSHEGEIHLRNPEDVMSLGEVEWRSRDSAEYPQKVVYTDPETGFRIFALVEAPREAEEE